MYVCMYVCIQYVCYMMYTSYMNDECIKYTYTHSCNTL